MTEQLYDPAETLKAIALKAPTDPGFALAWAILMIAKEVNAIAQEMRVMNELEAGYEPSARQ